MCLGVVAAATALWFGVGAVLADPGPTVRFTSAPSGTVATRYYHVTFVADNLTSDLYISRDGGAWEPCFCGLTGFGYAGGEFADGDHTFRVRIGSDDSSTATASWTVDTQLQVEFDAATSGTVPSSFASFSFTSTSISGLASGHGFECRIDGQVVNISQYVEAGEGYCSASGLADGAHTVAITPLDYYGVPAGPTAFRSWTVDTQAILAPLEVVFTSFPTAPVLSPILQVAFVAQGATLLECRKDGLAGNWAACGAGSPYGGSTVFDNSQAWLQPGTHTLEVRATAANGTVGPVATGTFEVAAPPPLVPTTTPTGVIPVSPDPYGYQADVMVESLPFATVECRFDPSNPADPSDDPAHPWSTTLHCSPSLVSIPGGLGQGTHAVQFRQRNYAGAYSASELVEFGLGIPDSVPPRTRISNGPPPNTTSTTAVLGYASTEFGSPAFACSLSKDGVPVLDLVQDGVQVHQGPGCSPSGSLTLTGLTPGTYTFVVHATDASGNADETGATRTWEVFPPASLDIAVNGPASLVNTGDAHVSFFLTSPVDAASFACRLTPPVGGAPTPAPSQAPGATPGPGEAFAACSSPIDYAGLGDGSYTFEVRAADVNGNVGPTAATTWTVDTTAPTVTINQDLGQTDPTTATTVHFTVEFSEQVTGFGADDVDLGGTATDFATVTTTGSGTAYDVAVTGLRPAGTVVASVHPGAALDAAGNPSAASTSTDATIDWSPATPPAVLDFVPAINVVSTGTHTLKYSLTFDQALDGISPADFAVGGTSTGWSVASVAFTPDGENGPTGIATDGTYVYVADANNARIVKRLASDLSYVAAAGTYGSGPGNFNGAYGIATDGTFVYVTDANDHRITKWRASDLAFVASAGTTGVAGPGNEQFHTPLGIATDGANVYVADTSNNRIVKLVASDLSYVSQATVSGPNAIAIHGSSLFVATRYSRIERYDTALNLQLAVGTSGPGAGQYESPAGIAADATSVYVADSGNNRIVKLRASDLTVVDAAGSQGYGAGEFNYPAGAATDGTSLFVADTFNNRVQKRRASDLGYVLQRPVSCYEVILTATDPSPGSVTLAVRANSVRQGLDLSNVGPIADVPATPDVQVLPATVPHVLEFSPATTAIPVGMLGLPYTLRFDQPVAGLTESDFTVGGTSTGWSVASVLADDANNDVYTVFVTAPGQPVPGTLTLSLNANSVTDASLVTAGPAADAAADTTVQITSGPAVGTGYTPRGADVVVVPAFGGAVSPITVSFGVVDAAGTTTMTLDTNGPALPSSYQLLGGLAFDLSTTATVHSRILVCVSYQGIATSAPSVLHFEGGAWKDITTDVDPAGAVVCGTTTSLGQFVIARPTPTVVERTGTQLTFDGQPYRPVGLNIYNANSNGWCRYAMDGTLLDDSLTAIGTGPNAIRAWFFQPLGWTGGTRDWTTFDRTLATAKAHGYKVIATLGDQWGDCGDRTGNGYGYKDTQWYQSAYRDADPAAVIPYRDWVAEVVLRYRNDPTILAWQLMNEPEVNSAKDADCSNVPESTAASLLKAFATDVSGLVRSIDPSHLISLGTLGGGQCGTQGDDYQSVMDIPNLDLCEYHDYTPGQLVPGDQWNGLQRRIDQCNALHKPLLVGELGVKPNEVGGTLADRARVVAAKACAQLSAGVAGLLVWNWDQQGGSSLTDYDIGPGDPVLDALAPWSDSAHTCTPPSSPRLFVAAAGDGTASLDWGAPASDGGSPLTGYRVTVSDGRTLPFPAGTTNATVNSLANGTAYTFEVSASNDVGSGPNASASVTPRAGAQGAAKAVPSSGGGATTDPGTGPTTSDPLTTSVTVPAGAGGGTLAITEAPTSGAPPTGFTLLGQQVDIESTAATASTNPLTIVFTLDESAVRAFDGLTATDPLPAPDGIDVMRDEGAGPAVVASCTSTGGGGSAIAPDPCIAGRTYVNGGTDLELTILTGAASRWTIVGQIRQPQTISFSNPGSRTMLESPLTVSATATSGLAVTFTTTTSGVCTAGGTNGSAITFVSAGSCTVVAHQAGGGVFDPAPPVSQTFTASKVAQTVTFTNPGGKTLAQSPVSVSGTASSGLPVQFSTTTILVCTAGGANGASITLLTTGTCTVRADQPGDATWLTAAPVSRSFTVSKANQTITFTNPGNKTLAQSPLTVSATASAGLPVTVTSTTTSVCAVSGFTVSLMTAGTCTLVASQAGNAVYNPATSVTRTITVSLATQTITFTNPGNKTMLQSPLAVGATASSGLPVTFITSTPLVCTAGGDLGSTITFVGPGTCTVKADQAGNDIYKPAPTVSRSFTVSKVAQTITFTSPGNRTMLQPSVLVTGTATSGLPISFATTTPLVCTAGGDLGSTITLVGTGTCTVKATQAGDAIYAAASPVSRNFTVSKVAQTITFATIAGQLLATGSITVSATASSGLTVTFATTTPAACTAGGPDGTVITFLAKGTCTVKATQAGNTVYSAASAVSRSFAIK